IYFTDLGADAIMRLPLTDAGRLGPPHAAYRAPPGSGPRHLLLHPGEPLAVLANELASTLTVLRIAGDTLEEIARHSLVPPEFAGETLGGHLALARGGERIYATNRGHDSIAVFALSADGDAEPFGHIA